MRLLRAWPALVFCTASVAAWSAGTFSGPPPLPKRPHKSAAVHQGAGAAALLLKPLAVVPATNLIVWEYPASINPSNCWWDIQTSTDLQNWSVLVSNASGVTTVNWNKSEPLRVYRLSAKLSP